MASLAEERIRAKAEAMMRAYYPGGRIVHELQCGQGEHRLDLACITTDRIVLAEIKSEKDTISRAEKQLIKATSVANEVWLCIASEHEAKVEDARAYWKRPFEEWDEAQYDSRVYRGVKIYIERDKEKPALSPSWKINNASSFDLAPDPYQQFDLLWREEMVSAIALLFGGASIPGMEKSLTRGKLIRLAVEHMSGREMRRAVCQQLRARHFPRADKAIPVETTQPA